MSDPTTHVAPVSSPAGIIQQISNQLMAVLTACSNSSGTLAYGYRLNENLHESVREAIELLRHQLSSGEFDMLMEAHKFLEDIISSTSAQPLLQEVSEHDADSIILVKWSVSLNIILLVLCQSVSMTRARTETYALFEQFRSLIATELENQFGTERVGEALEKLQTTKQAIPGTPLTYDQLQNEQNQSRQESNRGRDRLSEQAGKFQCIYGPETTPLPSLIHAEEVTPPPAAGATVDQGEALGAQERAMRRRAALARRLKSDK